MFTANGQEAMPFRIPGLRSKCRSNTEKSISRSWELPYEERLMVNSIFRRRFLSRGVRKNKEIPVHAGAGAPGQNAHLSWETTPLRTQRKPS